MEIQISTRANLTVKILSKKEVAEKYLWYVTIYLKTKNRQNHTIFYWGDKEICSQSKKECVTMRNSGLHFPEGLEWESNQGRVHRGLWFLSFLF